MTVQERIPAMNENEKKQLCYGRLNELGITFEVVDHDYADTIEQCHEVEKKLGCGICKNLLLTNRQMTDIYLLMMPGDKPFKTKYLSSQLGCARLSFATPEQMLSHLDITPGSLSVMGLINDTDGAVRLVIDRDLLKQEFIGCHPCINSASMKIRTDDILNVFLPSVNHTPTFVDLPVEQ